MKIVKLRKNQKLHKQGFTHAFKFNAWGRDTGAVLAALNKIYNNRQWRGRYWAWEVAKTARWKTDVNGQLYWPVYIGVRSAAVTSQVLLIM